MTDRLTVPGPHGGEFAAELAGDIPSAAMAVKRAIGEMRAATGFIDTGTPVAAGTFLTRVHGDRGDDGQRFGFSFARLGVHDIRVDSTDDQSLTVTVPQFPRANGWVSPEGNWSWFAIDSLGDDADSGQVGSLLELQRTMAEPILTVSSAVIRSAQRLGL